jgi:hypothetical protein
MELKVDFDHAWMKFKDKNGKYKFFQLEDRMINIDDDEKRKEVLVGFMWLSILTIDMLNTYKSSKYNN